MPGAAAHAGGPAAATASAAAGGPAAGASGAAPDDRVWQARPRRRLAWRLADDGRAVVLRPALGEGRAARWIAARLGDPHYRIRLDDVGTVVWQACDGETPLAAIAARLRETFGDRVEPAADRLVRFVGTMARSRLIDV